MKQMKLKTLDGKWFGFGFLTDTHLGSKYERRDLLNVAYKVFKQEGIEVVFHAGDVVEGERMFRGQEYEIHVHGAMSQVQHVVKNYPKFEGIQTYFITGSHDLSFYKTTEIDVGELIAERRKDLTYLGQEEADVEVNNMIIRLVHPGSGTAYAISYKPQKYIESLSGGQKPNVLLVGHFHKAEFMPCYRNVFSIQGGCLQSQTGFMRRNNNASHLGFWICRFCGAKKDLAMRFNAEFFAFYESSKILSIGGRL
jgi:predicted phosphodiesterase